METVFGDYRIKQLRKYFKLLKDKGIKLYIVSHNYANVILKALEFFFKNKIKYLIILMFVDDKTANVYLVKPYMYSYHVVDRVHGLNI